jgi:hypothetical protein
MLNVIILKVIMSSVLMLNVIMLNVLMLNVIMLNAIMLHVVEPILKVFWLGIGKLEKVTLTLLVRHPDLKIILRSSQVLL